MVGFFLWGKMMQPVGIALVMDRAPIFVNFAVAQIDWLETDGAQEGSISAHEHPQVCRLCIRECTACKRKDNWSGLRRSRFWQSNRTGAQPMARKHDNNEPQMLLRSRAARRGLAF